MRYYVRGNSRSQNTRIHSEDCRHYRPLSGQTSEWHGPYETLEDAIAKAEEFRRGPRVCKFCLP